MRINQELRRRVLLDLDLGSCSIFRVPQTKTPPPSAPPLGLDFKNPNSDPLGGEEEEDGEQSF